MTLQEALLRRGVPHRTSSGDRSKVHINCPFCVSRGKAQDGRFRLCLHAREGWGRCMHCDWKHRWAVIPTLKALGIASQVTQGVAPPKESEAVEVKLPPDFQLLNRVYDDLDHQARAYILKRGVTSHQIRENRIGVSYSGRYAYRIIFPIYAGKELKAINGRDFTGSQEPKYLLSKGDKYLYRFDPRSTTVVFSEGVIKALRIAQATEHGSAALLGHDLTDIQCEQIANSACKTAIIYPDSDVVGVRGALKIADKLFEMHLEVKLVWPVPGAADDLPLEELKQIIGKNQVPYHVGTCQAIRNKISRDSLL